MSSTDEFKNGNIVFDDCEIDKLHDTFIKSIIIGILAIVCFVLLRILFPIYQSPNFNIHKYFYIRYAYIFSMLGTIVFVPISSVLTIVNSYLYIRKINIVTKNSYQINEKEVLVCLLLPIVNILYMIMLIFKMSFKNYKIQNSTVTIDFKRTILLFIKSIVYIAFQSFMLYYLFRETDTVLIQKYKSLKETSD